MNEHAEALIDKQAMVDWLLADGDALLFVLGEDGDFKLANAAWERTTGWTQGELLGQPARKFIHGVTEFEQLAGGERAPQSGRRVRIMFKDGSSRWFEGKSERLPDGRLLGFLLDATSAVQRESELEEARQHGRELIRAAGIGRWVSDLGSGRISWADGFAALCGYDPAEISSIADFRDKLDPDEAPEVFAAFSRAVKDGEPHTLEHRFRAKDGSWTNWRATFKAERLADGGMQLSGLSQNITELTEARDAALHSEHQTRQLIEAAPFAVAMFDRESRYLVASPRWRASFGLNDREHIGQRFDDVSPGLPDRFWAARGRVLQGETVTSQEDYITLATGARRAIKWEIRPWRKSNDAVGGMLAYIDDISALTRAREEAKENSRRLNLALEAGEAGVYEIDFIKKAFWTSPEFKKLIGARGSNFEDARKLRFPKFHPEDLPRVREAFLAAQAQKRASSQMFEARIIKPNGEERWVRVFHHLQVSRTGRPIKGVGLVLDFDVRKRQELALIEAERAAQAAAEAKASFLANMSHEIRTPMNGVMGVLHLLKNEPLSEDGRNMLDEALSCGHMLAELLNDVIDFSKIEAGHLELTSEPMDPRAVALGVMRLLNTQAEGKGLTLTVEEVGEIGWVRSDPVRLRQALFNLVGNAVKFTLKGGVTLRSQLRETAKGPMLRFEVVDTGVGIPLDVQPRIFQRFDQGDVSTTRRFGGSGLGLSITKKLAEMMGGDVGFTSEAGKGSTFWLEIAAEPAAEVAAAVDADERFLEGLNILVVEDNATNRMIATKMLENLGARVTTAADGLLGVEAAATGAFDLILMDIQMPGIDGPEATRRIRQLKGPVAQTPIVALTANVLAHQRNAYLSAGMNGVVGKPISPAALLTEIARLSTAPEENEVAA